MYNTVDIVLPVHNEGASIEGTLAEFNRVVSTEGSASIRFVVCEDGSSDNTVGVLQRLARTLPIHLISDPVRKGYSRAVVDGLRATTAELVGFVDSDGQCDPRDFPAFLATHRAGNYDLVFGYRNPRRDHWARIAMSRSFSLVFRLFFRLPVRDPSCPFLLIRREALQRVLRGNPGILNQGFWWEFMARATAAKLRITEIPVTHRPRSAGTTQVYRLPALPRIAYDHLLSLVALKRELSASFAAK